MWHEPANKTPPPLNPLAGAERRASGAAVSRRLHAVVRLGAPRGLRVGCPHTLTPFLGCAPFLYAYTTPHSSPALTYWITSSAWMRRDGGIVSPSAWAVLRLRTSLKSIGCSTGRSAGLAPCRILCT